MLINDNINLNTGSYLVAAIGTEIGKTFFVENICKMMIKKDKRISAIKPIISGFDENDQQNDLARILRASNKENTLDNIKKISPWRFSKPLAPCFAADYLDCNNSDELKRNNRSLNGGEINFEEVVNFCKNNIKKASENNELLLIETAGGIMTPINFNYTFLDLASKINIPVILISANYLGAISHTLTAISAIKSKNIKISAIIINEHFGSVVDLKSLKKLFFSLCDIEILPLNSALAHLN